LGPARHPLFVFLGGRVDHLEDQSYCWQEQAIVGWSSGGFAHGFLVVIHWFDLL